MPYLRIFDPEEGSREYALKETSVYLGRSAQVDVCLNRPEVSRVHAVITQGESGHRIDDANSQLGIRVNEKKTNAAKLEHGDTIRISQFVIEYRTDDVAHKNSLDRNDDTAVDKSFRKAFRALPSSMNCRYRTVAIEPEKIFETGDTLNIGDGGIMLAHPNPPDRSSVIELEMTWPNKKSRTILAEVMAVLPGGLVRDFCVKMHNIERERYESVIKNSRRGNWSESVHTD